MTKDTSTQYDTIIKGGVMIDGALTPRRLVDIAIRGDRIVEIAIPDTLLEKNAQILNAYGKIVAPGFIDSHTHDDNALLKTPEMIPKLSQGVTTVIVGNCGISLVPLSLKECPPPPLNLIGEESDFCFESISQYAAAIKKVKPSVNVAMLIGHSTLRVGAMSDLSKIANQQEMNLMRSRLESAMEEGAIGFSTGTYYKTSAAADEDEIVSLAKVIAPFKGIYATHMRNEQIGIFKSLNETFLTAKQANVKVIISHHKCAGPEIWGRSAETLSLINNARKYQDIGLDVYPYNAGSTVLEPEYIDERFRIFVSWSEPHPEMIGKDLKDIAIEWGINQKEAAERLKPGGGVYFSMKEEDVRRILSDPNSMIGSDGLPRDVNPHPRLWGTFPRVLGHYSRDEGLFDLETAIYKMTGLTATNFRLKDRGIIRKGAFADIVVFDPQTIQDRATYDRPKQTAVGIDAVFVNGALSWANNCLTGPRCGLFLPNSNN